MKYILQSWEDLIKGKIHVKAHFRRDPKTGKLIYVKDFDTARDHAHHVISPGAKMLINNPRSKHHGKHAEVVSYIQESDKKKHFVITKVGDTRADLKPDHLEHLDGGYISHTPPPILRRPVKKIDPAPDSDPDPAPPKGIRPDAPFVMNPSDLLQNEYYFEELLDKFLDENPDLDSVETESDGHIRYYFSENAPGYRSADMGFIQVAKHSKRPHKVVFGNGEKNLAIAEFYKTLCQAWRKEHGGTLDIKGAFGDIGIKVIEKKDGNIELAGSTYAHRRIISKYADYIKDRNIYKMRTPGELVALLEKLPPFYTKEEIHEKDKTQDDIDATGPGAGDSGTDPLRSDASGSGAVDGRRNDGGGPGRAGKLPTASGRDARPSSPGRKLKSYNIKELVDIIHKRGVKSPDPHVTLRPRIIEDLTLYDHQIHGAQAIVSSFEVGKKGFLLGDDVGTGKTFTGAAVIAQMKPKRALITVPSDGVKKQWIKTLEQAGVKAIDASGTNTDYSATEGVLVCTDTTMSKNYSLHNTPNDLLIMDEAHRMKNLAESSKTSTRAEAAYNLVQKQMENDGKTLYMTATPYERPWQAQIYEALEMWEPGEFDQWVQKHGVNVKIKTIKDPVTGMTKEARAYSLVGNGKRAVKRTLISHIRNITGGCFLARETKPEGVSLYNHFHKTELDPDTAAQYKMVMNFFDNAIKGAPLPKDAFTLAGQRALWVKRFMEAAKLPMAIKVAKEELVAGRKVAIMVGYKNKVNIQAVVDKVQDKSSHMNPFEFEEFKKALKALGDKVEGTMAALEREFPNAAFYHGEVSQAMREKVKDEYNNGTTNVFIATQASADTGLDLHDTVGTTPRSQINVNLPWTAIGMKQLSGRSHRLGTKSDTRMHWLFGDDKNEKEQAALVSKKMEIMGASSSGIDVADTDDLYQRLVDFDMATGAGVESKSIRDLVKSFVKYIIMAKNLL